MNGKVARALRKSVGFDPHVSRRYETWAITREKYIYQFDSENKKVNIVKRPVEVPLIECVDGGRKLYQRYKKLYKGMSVSRLSSLPSKQELDALSEQIVKELKEKKKEVKSNESTEKDSAGESGDSATSDIS